MALSNSHTGFFSTSDLKMIHLLASRGLDFDKSMKLLRAEKEMIHENSNMKFLMDSFVRISKMGKKRILTGVTKDERFYRFLFCYCCKKYTNLSSKAIQGFTKINSYQTIDRASRLITDDIYVNHKPTIDFLNKIELQMLKTKK